MPKIKREIIIFLLITVFLISTGAWWCSKRGGPAGSQPEVCFRGSCLEIEVAESSQERQRGLMFRESLDEDKGMLFVFEKEGIYPFWMKNTLIPLDIIWLDNAGEIVDIKKNAAPCQGGACETFVPTGEAKYVLEINAGVVDKIGLSIGDTLILRE
ncbi:MAG: DUF192 domain-containing protein [Candidatus Nealsonbacteria bacterium]|nr:DUF192 domain-containing protein [Candidatus Nealsonbacteria bacterium]